jgi:hypothetical protein
MADGIGVFYCLAPLDARFDDARDYGLFVLGIFVGPRKAPLLPTPEPANQAREASSQEETARAFDPSNPRLRSNASRTGDTNKGPMRSPKDGERYFALLKVNSPTVD